MTYGNWTFYIQIPRNHFFTTITNSKRTYTKAMKIPRKRILLQFPEITFFRPFNYYQDTMIFGVSATRYFPFCLLRTNSNSSVQTLQILFNMLHLIL